VKRCSPGDVIGSWGDGGIGHAIVIATSRHQRTIAHHEARETLLAEAVNGVLGRVDTLDPWRPLLTSITGMRWHSVTQAEVDNDLHFCAGDGACDPGGWCSEGAGRAWVDVLNLTNAAVYAAAKVQEAET